MSIKAIIFDFFGVISSEVAPFWFAARYPEGEAKLLKEKYMGPADRGELSKKELFLSLSELSGESPERIEADFLRLAVIDQATVLLIRQLSRRYKIILLSNAQAELLHDILSRDSLYSLFDATVISGEEGIVKPSPEIFALALSRGGIRADEAIFTDDNIKNVKAASSLGIRSVLFEGAGKFRRALIDLGAL